MTQKLGLNVSNSTFFFFPFYKSKEFEGSLNTMLPIFFPPNIVNNCLYPFKFNSTVFIVPKFKIKVHVVYVNNDHLIEKLCLLQLQ